MSHSTLTINISQNYQLQCIVIDENNNNHIIKLNNQNDDYLPITISFDMNEIIIGKETNDLELAAQLYQTPNKYGELIDMPQKNAKELIISCVDLFALAMYEPPASDITVGDIQSFGIGMNFGGAYGGFVACRHAYKRQLLNCLHIIYLYQNLKENPCFKIYPHTFIFGAKAAPSYVFAKNVIELINCMANKINNDPEVNKYIKVVFIENYNVSNAEIIFAAADVSEQISTASKEASGTGNMKFMLNGALTLGTMDGANVEIVEEVGEEHAFIFGLSSDEVIAYENNGGYDPMEIFNNDQDIRKVLMQLINGTYSRDTELFRHLYNSLLNTLSTSKADTYFILKDFRSYAEAQRKVGIAYQDEAAWAESAILNVACSGKFTSDRTIQQYVDEIWHLDKVVLK